MAKSKKEVVEKPTAKKPVVKATEENNSNEWDMLQKSLKDSEKKFSDNGYVLNAYVNPCLSRYNNGERTESLKEQILKLSNL